MSYHFNWTTFNLKFHVSTNKICGRNEEEVNALYVMENTVTGQLPARSRALHTKQVMTR